MTSDGFGHSLPAGTRAWVLGSGKIGHEVNCLGVAHELGLDPELRAVRPRLLFQAMAPFGPIDPRDAPRHAGASLRGPFPDIVFASGRTTVPYLRHLKKASQRLTSASPPCRPSGWQWSSVARAPAIASKSRT
jgi:hypothetical protein